MLDEYERCLVEEIIGESDALFEVFKKKGLKEENPAYKAVERIVVLAKKLTTIRHDENNGSTDQEPADLRMG